MKLFDYKAYSKKVRSDENGNVIDEINVPDRGVNGAKITRHIILGICILILVFGSFTIVRPGQRGVIVTLGKVSDRIMGEGFHFKLPIVQAIV